MSASDAGHAPGTAWLQRPPVLDAIVVASLAVLSLLWAGPMFLGPKGVLAFGDAWPLALVKWWVPAGIALAALLVRRRLPATAFLVAAAAAGYHMAQGWSALPADAAAPLALFTVVTRYSPRRALGVVAATLAASACWAGYVDRASAEPPKAAFTGTLKLKAAAARKEIGGAPGVPAGGNVVRTLDRPPTSWGGFPVLALVVGLAWLAGENSRHRQAHLASLAQRAADLERDRARQAELATAAERARISRELHDVVAHGLSVIVIQAQGGAAELANRPHRTREALDAIVTTGRQSLAEMRRLLGVLRGPEDSGPPMEPQACLADLPRLVTRLRQAGMRIDYACAPLPAGLPVAVELSAYRSVQEALTNVAKHAGPDASATVRLAHRDGDLLVTVADDGGRVTAATSPAVARAGTATAARPAAHDASPGGDGGGPQGSAVRTPPAAGRTGPGRGGPDYWPADAAGEARTRHAHGEAPAAPRGGDHSAVPAGAGGGGHGLRGMRERASLLGGDLRAGPRPGGGFEVRVRLPTGIGAP